VKKQVREDVDRGEKGHELHSKRGGRGQKRTASWFEQPGKRGGASEEKKSGLADADLGGKGFLSSFSGEAKNSMFWSPS